MQDHDDHRQKWAEDRTDWAEDRTIQANERTFAGWMRTGMAAVALALGLKAIFGAFEPTWVAKAVATLFLVIAITIFWSARNRARQTLSRLDSHETEPVSTLGFTMLAVALTAGAIATGAVLWLL